MRQAGSSSTVGTGASSAPLPAEGRRSTPVVKGRRPSSSEARERRARDVAAARARTTAARLDLDVAITGGERDYRLLRARLDDYDRRLDQVRQMLRGRERPSPRRVAQGPHC